MEEIKYKCKECHKYKHFNMFVKEKRSESGISSICKECSNKSKRIKRYNKNKSEIEESKYLDSIQKRKCKYCKEIKNHDLFTKHENCKYGILKICLKCSNERVKKWRSENKEKVNSFYQKYKTNNKINISKSNKKYEQKNRDKINTRIRKRRDTDNNFHMMCVIRSRMEHAFNSKNTKKRFKTLDLVGCSINELRDYLELLFIDGMSWDNYGYYGWHIDHKKPCSKFDLTDIEQQRKCFHYTNLQPLWAKDNIKKSDKWEG